MNLLIVGGLMAFALVAILAAFLLALGEQKASKAAQTSAPATQEPQSSVSAPSQAQQDTDTNKPNLPVLSQTALPISNDVLNGQFHEFAAQIHTLHQEARQLEQRLSVLVEMVDQFEQSQEGLVSIEEELALPADAAR